MALVPALPPVVAVMACAVAETVLVVNETVAMPLALVVDVGAPNEPPPVADHVTTWPLVWTALLFTSANWAVMVTDAPATGEKLVEDTAYFVAVPAVNVTTALLALEMLWPLTVPETVDVPIAADDVSVAVQAPPVPPEVVVMAPAVAVSAGAGGAVFV